MSFRDTKTLHPRTAASILRESVGLADAWFLSAEQEALAGGITDATRALLFELVGHMLAVVDHMADLGCPESEPHALEVRELIIPIRTRFVQTFSVLPSHT